MLGCMRSAETSSMRDQSQGEQDQQCVVAGPERHSFGQRYLRSDFVHEGEGVEAASYDPAQSAAWARRVPGETHGMSTADTKRLLPSHPQERTGEVLPM